VSEYIVDPMVWFSVRELAFTPRHFVVANQSLTIESRRWILSNLTGRFSIVSPSNIWDDDGTGISVIDVMGKPAFEDPKEALLYELTWS
jgi:hypothetical protein